MGIRMWISSLLAVSSMIPTLAKSDASELPGFISVNRLLYPKDYSHEGHGYLWVDLHIVLLFTRNQCG